MIMSCNFISKYFGFASFKLEFIFPSTCLSLHTWSFVLMIPLCYHIQILFNYKITTTTEVNYLFRSSNPTKDFNFCGFKHAWGLLPVKAIPNGWIDSNNSFKVVITLVAPLRSWTGVNWRRFLIKKL